MLRLFAHFALGLAFVLGSLSCHGQAIQTVRTDTIATLPSTERYTLVFAGDIMAHGPQIKAAHRGGGAYDFSSSFDSLKRFIASADLAIGNFETTFGGRPFTGYPQFSTPDAMGVALRDAGFDILTTSNNHSADRGKRGITRTLDVLDSLGIAHVGSYRSADERATSSPLIRDLGTIRLAVMAYTYGTNGMPVPHPTLVDTIDRALIARDLARADSLGANYKVVQIHWGNEYERTPSADQRALAQWLHEHGVDAVIGSHPHVVQTSTMLGDSTATDRTFVIYSMGNFISNQRTPAATRGGMLLTLTLEKASDSPRITTMPSYQWVFVAKQDTARRGIYRLLPVDITSEDIPAGIAPHEQADYLAFRRYYRSIPLYTPSSH